MRLSLKRPKAILFDVNGTATNTTFADRVLSTYFRHSLFPFLKQNWSHTQVQRDIKMLREVAKDKKWPAIAEESEAALVIQESVRNLVEYLLDQRIDCLELAQLRFHVWFDGYAKGFLLTQVYSDVAIQMQKWRCDQDIKLYVVSNGWSVANKVFLSHTNQGDMTLLIDDFFDTSVGQMTESETFDKILKQIKQSAKEVILFTKSGPMAQAAAKVGVTPILVLTHQKFYDILNEEEKKITLIRTMNQIEFD